MIFPRHARRPAGAGRLTGSPSFRLMEDPLDHFVKLDRLPEDLKLPPQFQNRLEFDSIAQKLIFHGYMSKSEFDQISSLTTDWRFRRTLEELFRQCTPDDKPATAGIGPRRWPHSASSSQENDGKLPAERDGVIIAACEP